LLVPNYNVLLFVLGAFGSGGKGVNWPARGGHEALYYKFAPKSEHTLRLGRVGYKCGIMRANKAMLALSRLA